MKYLGLIIAIGVLLLLGSTPCLADTGAGVSVQLETTVVGGSSSSGSGYYGGGGGTRWYRGTPPVPPVVPPVIPPTIPPVIPEPVPPVLPKVDIPVPDKPFAPGDILPLPSYSLIYWYLAGAIAIALILMGLIIWYFKRKRS
jgi:hypothetical protein